MKILLLGSNGQVGWECQRSLAVLGDVVALQRDRSKNPGGLKGDLSDMNAVREIVRQVRPDWIVNAAAYTAVDKAEEEQEVAHHLNAVVPGAIAELALEIDAGLVHYSTDYVFDGAGESPRAEDAPTAPLNIYGQTKLEGEQRITQSGCRHLIFRTSWVYAARGANFAKTMLRLAGERDKLSVIADQFGAPTGAELIADVTSHAIGAAQSNSTLNGIYHLVASGETSWHEYAKFVIEYARAHGHHIEVSPDNIGAVPTTAFPTPAERPLNSRLNNRKLAQQFGLSLPDWQSGVERMLEEYLGAIAI